jgi:DNA polymerase III subunit delta'
MNWNILGHEWAVDYMQRSIANGRDSHAYLISGPAGIGKALLAHRLAQVLNCDVSNHSPCLQCRSCRRIERGNHPDVRLASMETQAAQAKATQSTRQKDLKIDTVREWQHDIALKPYEGRRRVFILLDAERLSEEASNAMLKTLEEPPLFATLILVANSVNLLPTIVSRCQHIRLRLVPRQYIAQVLIEQKAMDDEHARLLAAWSGGRIGWALHMADAPDEMQAHQERLETLLSLQKQPRNAAFLWAEERTKEYRGGEQDMVLEWLELWRSWWHDVLLVAAGCPEYIMHVNRRRDLETEAQRYALFDVYGFVTRLGETVQQLRENVNPQLAMENVFLHLPHGR